MPLIGSSIQEAIDWTQDHLVTTRPLAERTLFSLMQDKQVKETSDGYLLVEEDGEEEMHKRHQALKHKSSYRPRFRFHKARKQGHKHLRHYFKHQFQRLEQDDDAADEEQD